MNFLLKLFSDGFLFFVLHLKNIGAFPPALNSKDEKKYLNMMKNGDKEAKSILIEHNLRLVAHIVKKFNSDPDEQDDLISIGTIGLIKGINSFDEEKGIKLATYASKCIENEILMYFRGRKKSSQDVSINEPIDVDSEGNPLTLMDIISIDDTAADDIDKKLKTKDLYRFVEEIEDGREREILIRRYGLYGVPPLTQKQIAKKMDISRSYVSRIEKRAIENLRKRFKA